jgi:hypothetical protein
MRTMALGFAGVGIAFCIATTARSEPFDAKDLAGAFELSKTCSNECKNKSVSMVRLALPNGRVGFLITTNDLGFCGSGGCSSIVVLVTGNKFVTIREGLGITKDQAVSSALGSGVATPRTPPRALESFEGIWAKTQAECLDEEGPNSRTLIDLEDIIDGKPVPMFDQYENHCRIERKSVVGDATNLAVTCFEFWEYFTKGIEGQKATIKLSPVQKGGLKIDGTPYQRCAAKGTPDQPGTAQSPARQEPKQIEANAPPPTLPESERLLIAAAEKARAAYAAGANEMAQGAARPARAKDICAAIKNPQVSGWVGEVETLSSNSDGLGVLAIRIAKDVLIKTWNNSISDSSAKTLIDPESAVFKKAVVLRKGQRVKFAGQFIRDDTDCFREGSLSLKGSLTQPEFIFRFSDLVGIE